VRATSRIVTLLGISACLLAVTPNALAGDAPSWMHSLVGVQLPTYDEKTDAVLLYSDTNVTVVSADKVRMHVREAYKILRPNGRDHGTIAVPFDSNMKILNLHGWCIPAQGKDYEVKEKDAVDASAVADFELFSDEKKRILRIPAPDPGNIVGYEFELERRPYFLQDEWSFQEMDPVRETHFSLQLPVGWAYKSSWIGHSEVKPEERSGNSLQWSLTDVQGIRWEPDMPPWRGVASKMVVSFFPSGGTSQKNELLSWEGMGGWYQNLTSGRLESSDAIKKEVNTLASGKQGQLAKMQEIADFLQHQVRYVEITLGIGGFQPHAAADVYSHRYGDCKDKATLMQTMLREMGVDSYYVLINVYRGSVTKDSPPHNGFNHAITAIRLPDGMNDPSLVAVLQHPKLGKLLFFDPTDRVTPFGQIRGDLQSNFGLLIAPQGGELVELPQQPSSMNGILRTAKLTVDPTGTLRGNVKETRMGDSARSERYRIRDVEKDSDRIKPIESLLGGSLTNFHITKASILNLTQTSQPFGFDYSFESERYAKSAGNLLLVRPRVLGVKSLGILETKEPRKFPIQFESTRRDTDDFEITIPAGYEVDDLPPAVDSEYSFASYHSKTEVKGQTIHYQRTFEVKEMSVPVAQADDLKKFYRIIASDERNNAVLKPAGSK